MADITTICISDLSFLLAMWLTLALLRTLVPDVFSNGAPPLLSVGFAYGCSRKTPPLAGNIFAKTGYKRKLLICIMKEDGYKIRDQFGIYFITFAVVQWVDVFSRYCYAETVLNSLAFCIKEKGLKVHAWCIMSNHIHLIVSAENGNLSDVLRDFKSFTAKKILQQIEDNKEESRKNCLPRTVSAGDALDFPADC